MNFNEYRPLALGTAKRFATLRDDFEHACLGLSTESGEVNTVVKRVAIYGKEFTPKLYLNIHEELGDTGWYVPLAMLAMGIDVLDPMPDADLAEMFDFNTDSLKMCGLMLAALCGSVSMFALVPDDAYGTRNHREEIRNILSAIVFLIDRMAVMTGTTGDQLRKANYIKLNSKEDGRFPNGYSDIAAEARADKHGLDATQS